MTRSSAAAAGSSPLGDAVGHGLGDGVLGGAEHLHGLLHALDRHLGDQHRRRLGDQVRGQHGQQVGVPGRLVRQGVGEGDADRAVLLADQEVDVGDLVALADQCFADVHEDVAGHAVAVLPGCVVCLNRRNGPGLRPSSPSRLRRRIRSGSPLTRFLTSHDRRRIGAGQPPEVSENCLRIAENPVVSLFPGGSM